MQPLTLVHKLLIFWYLHAFSSGRRRNTRYKARENRSPDSNSYSMHVYIKRIHLHAFETQMLIIKISQSIPVNLVSYLSFFHNCFYEEGKKKNIPGRLPVTVALCWFSFEFFAFIFLRGDISWYEHFDSLMGFSCFFCSIILQESYTEWAFC